MREGTAGGEFIGRPSYPWQAVMTGRKGWAGETGWGRGGVTVVKRHPLPKCHCSWSSELAEILRQRGITPLPRVNLCKPGLWEGEVSNVHHGSAFFSGGFGRGRRGVALACRATSAAL